MPPHFKNMNHCKTNELATEERILREGLKMAFGKFTKSDLVLSQNAYSVTEVVEGEAMLRKKQCGHWTLNQ